MSRIGIETELLLISEAVERLKARIYGGRKEPELIAKIKKSVKKGEHRPSIGSGSQKEDAAKLIFGAIIEGEVPVYVRPVSTEDKMSLLQVPLDLLKRMISVRGGFPDHAVHPRRIFSNNQIVPELLAALSTSALYVDHEKFEAWCKEVRKKRKWPSQRSRSKKNPIGRPLKHSGLHTSIAELVNAGEWDAKQNFIADLGRLLDSRGLKVSRQTVKRAVIQLHRETLDPRYDCADPRKQPDESVWGSFEDLAERRRRQHRK